VISQSPSRSPFIPIAAYSSAYSRSFEGVTFDHAQMITFVSSVVVARSESKVAEVASQLAIAMRTPSDRKILLETAKRSFVGTSHTTDVSIGFLRHRVLQVGDATDDLAFAIHANGTVIDVGELFIQVGTVEELDIYVSDAPGLNAGGAFALAKAAAARIEAATQPAPKNTALPTVAGTIGLAQILTAHEGFWNGAGITYAYQWFRCSSSGGACVAIPGSTQQTYTVSTADENATLAVSVSATNPAGTTIAMSGPTTAVSSAVQ
jgi:hypothetical protein